MVYLPNGSSPMSYLPSLSDTPSRRSWVEFSTAVMWVCPSSLPDGSVTVPVKPLRSTCAMDGTEQERDKIVKKIKTDGEKRERNFCTLASKGRYRVTDKAGCSSSSPRSFRRILLSQLFFRESAVQVRRPAGVQSPLFLTGLSAAIHPTYGAILGLRYGVASDRRT